MRASVSVPPRSDRGQRSLRPVMVPPPDMLAEPLPRTYSAAIIRPVGLSPLFSLSRDVTLERLTSM